MKGLSPAVSESIFRIVLCVCGGGIVLVLSGIVITLLCYSWPILHHCGLSFFVGNDWDVLGGKFGGAPFLAGTLLTAFLALAMAVPFSIAVALLLGEYLSSGWIATIFRSTIELLAGIPSVIFGFWGLFVVVPIVRDCQIALGISPYGIGIFTAAFILAIMIIPYATTLSQEVIMMVPIELKEAYAFCTLKTCADDGNRYKTAEHR